MKMRSLLPILPAFLLAFGASAQAQQGTLMFDFGPTTVTPAMADKSPLHTAQPSFSGTTWNKMSNPSDGDNTPVIGLPNGTVKWSDGTAAGNVSLSMGTGPLSETSVVFLDGSRPMRNNALGAATNTGVYAAGSVGTDGVFHDTTAVAAQVNGLAAGTYDVYVAARNTSQWTPQAHVVHVGESESWASQWNYENSPGKALTYRHSMHDGMSYLVAKDAWAENENYVKFTVTLAAGKALNVVVRGKNPVDNSDLRGFINAIQVVPASPANPSVNIDDWRQVPLGGGGYVTGLTSTPSGDTIYIRTDVGGLFRWVPSGSGGSWKSLSDKMVPYATPGASSLLFTESFAVDPHDPNRLYVVAGASNADACGLYTSANRGDTWTRVPGFNFPSDGNGAYRISGERLAVDPNNANIVWVGTGKNGLQKGVKNGSNWTWTQISSVPLGTEKAGVVFVACDKNGSNTIVYAGVHGTASGGVYRSTNGTGFTKLTGPATQTPWQGKIADNGTLYVTGGDNTSTTRRLVKVTRGATALTEVTVPAMTTTNYPQGQDGDNRWVAAAVDRNNANTVYIGNNRGRDGAILRSTDGGASWSIQTIPSTYTQANGKRSEPDGANTLTGYWFGKISSLLINPANTSQLWAGDYFGVARTNNAQQIGSGSGAQWHMLQKNQDETVVFAVRNAPGASSGQPRPRLLAGIADVGGYVWLTDTDARPDSATNNGARLLAGNGAGEGNITGLDFSEGFPNNWVLASVRFGSNSPNQPGTGAYSSDHGVTWVAFGQVGPDRVLKGAPRWESWDLNPAWLNRHKGSNTTVTLILASGIAAGNANNDIIYHSKEAADASLRPRLVINGTALPAGALQADAFVVDWYPSNNYGTDTRLKTFRTWGPGQFSYLRFSLANAPATITSAKLELYRTTNVSDVLASSVAVYASASETWTESGLTFANRPKPLTDGSSTGDPRGYDYYAGSTRLAGGRIAVAANNRDNLVWMPIGTSNPIHYSNDRGVTWKASAGGPPSQISGAYTNGTSVAPGAQPLASDRKGGYFYAAKFGGPHLIYRSVDGGANWTQVASVSTGGYNPRTPQLIAAPTTNGNGGDLWLCDDASYSGGDGGLWRSTNMYAASPTWTKFANARKVGHVTFGKGATANNYSVFIAGEAQVSGTWRKGVFQSDDYGANWKELPVPTIARINALGGDRQNHGGLFLGSDGRGVFQLGTPVVAGGPPPPQSGPLKVWPVGDSITEGNGWNSWPEQYTYRWHLQKKLHATGVAYDFVGSKDKGYNPNKTWPDVAPGKPFDPHHNGYWGGKTADVVTSAKAALQVMAAAPDVVLIHLGTNDQSSGATPAAIQTDVINPIKDLVTAVRAKNANAKFFIGRIALNYDDVAAGKYATRINAEIDKIPDGGFSTAQSPVVVVQHNVGWIENPGLATTDTHDWVHPNPQGQNKMAQKWYDAMKAAGVPNL